MLHEIDIRVNLYLFSIHLFRVYNCGVYSVYELPMSKFLFDS